MNKFLLLVITATILFSCKEKEPSIVEEGPVLVTPELTTATLDESTPNVEDLKEKANYAVVNYMTAMNDGNIDDLMDLIFKEAMFKAGLNNEQIRESLNTLMESDMKPFNLKSFSLHSFTETDEYYIFTVPTEASAYLDGKLVDIKSQIFAISDKTSNGETWMFIDNGEQTKQIFEDNFPELSEKPSFSKPEILSIEY